MCTVLKTTNKLSIFLLIFASCSCSVKTEKESVFPQNTANTTANLTKSARTSPIVNTIALRTIVQEIGKPPLFMVSFGTENTTSEKASDGKKHFEATYRSNFIMDEKGTVLTELSPDEVAPGNPLFRPGNPIGGIIVKLGKNPGGGVFKVMKTDENGEIILPEDLEEGDYEIKIEIGAAGYIVFNMTIGNEKITPKIAKESHGMISNVDAPNMLINQDGTIRNFYYEEDFRLHSDIAKSFGLKEIVIAKGYYQVDYSDKKEGGSVNLTSKKFDWAPKLEGGRVFEGTNPKGIDCKGFGIACFYNAERGIDKKDIRHYVVKPIIEKDILIGVEISEGKKGLNAVNMKKAITESGIK